jgi:hypothetical protein
VLPRAVSERFRGQAWHLQEAAVGAVLFVVTLAFWAPGWDFGLASPAPYDEGNTVVAAWRVLAGEALYRDVWQIQAPGTAYLVAAAFALFGTTLMVERVLKSVLLAATVVVLHRVHRRFASAPAASASSLLFGCLASHPPFLRPAAPALLSALVAVLLGLRWLERGGRHGLAFAAGTAAGITAVFRHDLGACVVVGIGAAMALSNRAAGSDERGRAWPSLALLGTGAALPVLFALLGLAWQGVVGDAYRQAIVFAATSYVENRRLPFVQPAAAVAAILPVLAGVALATARRARGHDAPADSAALLVGLAGLLVFASARLRPDPEHLTPVYAFALPLTVYLGVALRSAPALAGRPAWRTTVTAAIALVLGAVAVVQVVRQIDVVRARDAAIHGPAVVAPPRAAGFIGFPADLAAAVAAVQSQTAPGVRLFVGNERHDRILINHALFYFLADRPGVTPYYNLHPGLATTRAVQDAIVRDLSAHTTPVVVTWQAPLWDEPNATSPGSGVGTLDAFVRRTYRVARRFGAFTVWEWTRATPGAKDSR